MSIHLKEIISGGQTGADQGGLLAARELGIRTGGTAPLGWLTEHGPKEDWLRSFGLTECETEGYAARTRRNVADSDGTLLVGSYRTGGSRFTYEVATELKKPTFHLACSVPPEADHDRQRIDEFRYWLERYAIKTLNVAGNRESQTPGIAEFTRSFLIKSLGDTPHRFVPVV